jgi:hypothetical protein
VARFTARIEVAGGGGHWIPVPVDVKQLWGQARPPVVARVAGVKYRSRLAVYGGRTVLGVRKATLAEAGVAAGDEVEVELERDDAPREVVVPQELDAALSAQPDARSIYESLSFTHRRECAEWIGSAKREETRERRAARAIEMLLAGERTPG